MKSIIVVGEDALCCALGEKLVQELLPEWCLPVPSINKRGITKLIPDLSRFCQLAQVGRPVLCVADVDRGCAVHLLQQWLPRGKPSNMLLRLAVSESESWILADREGLQQFIDIPTSQLPQEPDNLLNTKQHLLALVNRYGTRNLRREMVHKRTTDLRPGTGYNEHLTKFVLEHWQPNRAATRSPSLQRAIKRLEALGKEN